MDVVEVERKYDVDRWRPLPAFEQALPESARLETDAPTMLDATYFDTEDRRLVHCGVTLRRRSGGTDAGWHLKIPGGEHTRLEIHRSLSTTPTGEVPIELADLVFARSRGKSLRPVARIQTTRTVSRVVTGEGDSIAELADDAVQAEVEGGFATRTWRELEIEVQPAGKLVADQLDALLRAAGVRELNETSKLARALGIFERVIEAPRPRDLDIVRRRLRQQTDELLARDLDVRRGLPEGVHDMRVATRRIRSCLETFAPAFVPEAVSSLLEELRWLAAVLGRVRDAEVLAERLDGDVAKHLAGVEEKGVRALVGSWLTLERTEGRSVLQVALRSERYAALLDSLDALADHPPYIGDEAPKRSFLIRRAEREMRQVARLVRVGQRARGSERDAALHKARKAAKRARYAAETITSFSPRQAPKLARRFARIQEFLGNRQDLVVARSLLRRLASSGIAPEASFGVGLLAGWKDAEIAKLDTSLAHLRAADVPKL